VGEDRLVHATGVDVEWPEPSLRLFDLRSGAVIRTLPSRSHDHVTISPDGRVLATWGPSTGVQLWDVEAGTERLPHTGHRGPITAMAFTSDGTRVVTGAMDSTVRVWDARTGAQQRVLPVGLSIDALALDGNERVVVSAFSHVEVWRLADGARAFASHRKGSQGNGLTIAFTPDGGAVEYNTWSGNPVYRWDLARDVTTTRDDPMLERLQELSFHDDDEVSADRQRALTREPGAVVLRELPSFKEIERVAAGIYPAMAIAPDSKAFAVGEPHGRITWIAGGRRRELQPFGDARITALAFSLDGRTLACGAADGRVALWRPGD
jgi:WD40 repeat protein